MTTLKQLVDETTAIKNDIITCHGKLRTNLANKNVQSSQSDKLPTLIDKVNYIDATDVLSSGDNNTLFANGFVYAGESTIPPVTFIVERGATQEFIKVHSKFKGSIRFFVRVKADGSGYGVANYIIEHKSSSGSLKKSEVIELRGSVLLTKSFDIADIEKNDYFVIKAQSTTTSRVSIYIYATDMKYL